MEKKFKLKFFLIVLLLLRAFFIEIALRIIFYSFLYRIYSLKILKLKVIVDHARRIRENHLCLQRNGVRCHCICGQTPRRKTLHWKHEGRTQRLYWILQVTLMIIKISSLRPGRENSKVFSYCFRGQSITRLRAIHENVINCQTSLPTTLGNWDSTYSATFSHVFNWMLYQYWNSQRYLFWISSSCCWLDGPFNEPQPWSDSSKSWPYFRLLVWWILPLMVGSQAQYAPYVHQQSTLRRWHQARL